MLYACVESTESGIKAEAMIRGGCGRFTLIAPCWDKIEREDAKERVHCAIVSSGYIFPKEHVTVNVIGVERCELELQELDLLVAVAILRATEQIPDQHNVELKELRLSGETAVKSHGGINHLKELTQKTTSNAK